mgnify:CR=1 FL=1
MEFNILKLKIAQNVQKTQLKYEMICKYTNLSLCHI